MEMGRQALVGLFWGAVERFATQGISFAVVLILARLLGPANYGLVTLAATIALFGQTLLGETFSQALIQQRVLEPKHVSSLFWVLTGAGLLAGIAQWVFADALASLFDEAGLAPILRALSPLLLLTAVQAVPVALFKRALDFRKLAAASALGTALGGAIGVGLAFAGFGPWSLVANLLAQNAIVTISVWRQSPLHPVLVFSAPHLRQLWSYGQYTFCVRIAAFTANQAPRILVGYLFGPAALGAFSLGLRIIEILYQLLGTPAVNVVVSVIAKLRDDPQRLERTVLIATQFTALVTVPIFVALALAAPLLVPLVFGAKWAASIPIIQILCLYGIVGSCGLIWGAIIGGLGRPDITLLTTSSAAIVSVSVLLLAAPWGLGPAAAAFVARGYLTLPFMPLIIARLTGISAGAQYAVFTPVILASATMGASMEAMILAFGDTLSALPMLVLLLSAGAFAYALALCLFARPQLRLGVSFLTQLRPSHELA